jgi:hypothetical protein
MDKELETRFQDLIRELKNKTAHPHLMEIDFIEMSIREKESKINVYQTLFKYLIPPKSGNMSKYLKNKATFLNYLKQLVVEVKDLRSEIELIRKRGD